MSDWPVWFRCYGEGLIGGHKFNGFWHHHFYVVLPYEAPRQAASARRLTRAAGSDTASYLSICLPGNLEKR
jgi:hypothetical protein